MMSDLPHQWEIWHARFDFSEGHGYEFRPVLVIDSAVSSMLVAMITSATNQLSLPHDCIIEDWGEAGLIKPSLVRLDRIVEIPIAYIGTSERIGNLSPNDIVRVVSLLPDLLPAAED